MTLKEFDNSSVTLYLWYNLYLYDIYFLTMSHLKLEENLKEERNVSELSILLIKGLRESRRQDLPLNKDI